METKNKKPKLYHLIVSQKLQFVTLAMSIFIHHLIHFINICFFWLLYICYSVSWWMVFFFNVSRASIKELLRSFVLFLFYFVFKRAQWKLYPLQKYLPYWRPGVLFEFLGKWTFRKRTFRFLYFSKNLCLLGWENSQEMPSTPGWNHSCTVNNPEALETSERGKVRHNGKSQWNRPEKGTWTPQSPFQNCHMRQSSHQGWHKQGAIWRGRLSLQDLAVWILLDPTDPHPELS